MHNGQTRTRVRCWRRLGRSRCVAPQFPIGASHCASLARMCVCFRIACGSLQGMNITSFLFQDDWGADEWKPGPVKAAAAKPRSLGHGARGSPSTRPLLSADAGGHSSPSLSGVRFLFASLRSIVLLPRATSVIPHALQHVRSCRPHPGSLCPTLQVQHAVLLVQHQMHSWIVRHEVRYF